jgi:hypothetical protein
MGFPSNNHLVSNHACARLPFHSSVEHLMRHRWLDQANRVAMNRAPITPDEALYAWQQLANDPRSVFNVIGDTKAFPSSM